MFLQGIIRAKKRSCNQIGPEIIGTLKTSWHAHQHVNDSTSAHTTARHITTIFSFKDQSLAAAVING